MIRSWHKNHIFFKYKSYVDHHVYPPREMRNAGQVNLKSKPIYNSSSLILLTVIRQSALNAKA